MKNRLDEMNMKWLALLLFGVLTEAIATQDCGDTQTINNPLRANQYESGALSVPTLDIRNSAPAAEIFKYLYATIHNEYGMTIGSTDAEQIVQLGQNLIDAIRSDYTKLKESIQQAAEKSEKPNRVNQDLERLNKRLDTLLELKPGLQKVLSNVPPMPPKPEYRSIPKNLTVSQAFLHLAETMDMEWVDVGGYADALHWYGWERVRKFHDLRQTQARNQVLNNKVLPVYRNIVNEVYSMYTTIQKSTAGETWARFAKARQSIVDASDSYKKALEAGECSS